MIMLHHVVFVVKLQAVFAQADGSLGRMFHNKMATFSMRQGVAVIMQDQHAHCT